MKFERLMDDGRLWAELIRINRVRDYLISLGIVDYYGFEEYSNEEN